MTDSTNGDGIYHYHFDGVGSVIALSDVKSVFDYNDYDKVSNRLSSKSFAVIRTCNNFCGVITMAYFKKSARRFLIVIVVAIAYLVLIPPIPSEANSQQKLGFLNLPALVSLVLFYFAVIFSKRTERLFKHDCLSPKSFLLFYGICLVFHLLIRLVLWQFGHLSEYGYPFHNIFVISLVYSLLMSLVLIPLKYFHVTTKEEEEE